MTSVHSGHNSLGSRNQRHRGGIVTTNVTMADGTEQPLTDHLRDAHQKGTRGLTEEFLGRMHETLHQPDRETPPEHDHLGLDGPGDEDEGAQAS